jgi:hypothetical protein
MPGFKPSMKINYNLSFAKIVFRIKVHLTPGAMRFFPQSFLLFFTLIIVSSCYTPRGVHSKTIAEPEKQVMDFMVLFVPINEDIYQLDKQTYDRLLMGNYNDLQYKTFRTLLTDGFRKKFKGTFIHDYQNFFTDHNLYSYDDFVRTLKDDGVKHILLITLKSQKDVIRPVVTSDMAIPVNYSDRSYQIYLFDINQSSPLWLSYGFHTSTGGLVGIRKTANQLARGAARELDKEQLLFASSYGRLN